MVNSDESGLSDEESDNLDAFSEKVLSEGYNAIPLGGGEHIEFFNHNDIDGLAGDCHKVSFQSL